MAEHAVHMAERFGSDLILAHVREVSGYYYATYELPGDPGAIDAALDRNNREQLADLVRRVSIGKPIETLVVSGDPAQRIEELIQQRHADLVMMATHGYGTFRRFILGSVTAKVLHDTHCPVFTGTHVPEVAKFDPEPYKRVACAIDLKEHSEVVLRWAWDFTQAWGADLIVLHAAPTLDTNGTYVTSLPADTRDLLVGHAEAEIEKLCKKVGCKAEVHVECANLSQYVKDMVKETYADAIVIGRSAGESIVGRLHTHAYSLIRESPCPVISV
jgi:nucleotide-binding universal stress UspA family protein